MRIRVGRRLGIGRGIAALFGRGVKPSAAPIRVAPPPDPAALKARYAAQALACEMESFVLYRIVGNDLVPRHKKGQSRENLRFILENEPTLERCTKRWIVNRIVNPEEEASVIALLEAHRQDYMRIPFEIAEYQKIDLDLDWLPATDFFGSDEFERLDPEVRQRARLRTCYGRINYFTHNNGARNAALREGRTLAKWILPWDGNCFLTESAWREIAQAVTTEPYFRYFIVPMARVLSNAELLRPAFAPNAEEEPQVLFRSDAPVEFDESYPYGRRSKVELLWRLGVPGPWDKWRFDPFDLPRPDWSQEVGEFRFAGWVARLHSGEAQLDGGHQARIKRGRARSEALLKSVEELDRRAARWLVDPPRLISYREDDVAAVPEREFASGRAAIAAGLIADADAAVARGTYSVIDKTDRPPSGDPHDYWHPAPYWWPNPDTPDGIPYLKRDGERRPGTRLYEPGSERYDRTRLQRLFDDTTISALAWRATGERRYAEHGAALVQRWFVATETCMNPNLRYAQVRMQRRRDLGRSSGIIEMKDLYYFLDAVRFLEEAGTLGPADLAAFRGWLTRYCEWLVMSDQGRKERGAENNHGTYYDLQLGAIACYLRDAPRLAATLERARRRLARQFAADGSQPLELERPEPMHYCCFNLQGWVNLAILAERCGANLWMDRGSGDAGIVRGLQWLARRLDGGGLEAAEPGFDRERLRPLYTAYNDRFDQCPIPISVLAGERYRARAVVNPDFGIRPYWFL
jgi:Alginate lyase